MMTMIIAEIGSNFSNEKQQMRAIELAAQAGADCIKYQLFTETDLYGPLVDFERRSIVDVRKLSQHATNCGIGFLCTPFSPSGVKEIEPYVGAIKIASAEMCHVELLEAAKATGKPIILSTGGHTLGEVHRSICVLGYAATRTTLMYCESAYPSNAYMPEKLGLLARETGLPVGVSDHSKEIYLTAWMAQHFDAPVIEKHVDFFAGSGPDSGHSLNYDEFVKFCRYLNDDRFIVNDILSDNEADMVTQHNRRLVATCDIPEGTVMVSNLNFGSYRGQSENAHALLPFYMGSVQGRVATRTINANEAICEGDYV